MSQAIASPPTKITPEELLRIPNGEEFELVDGELVERNMGLESSRIEMRLGRFLDTYCDEQGLGLVLSASTGYQCFPDAPNKVRRPDISFISLARIPADSQQVGHVRIAPDLAVEIVSLQDTVNEVDTKVSEYLIAGVRLIWVVNPDSGRALVYRQDGSGAVLSSRDELSGEDVIPGFRLQLALLLKKSPTPNETE